jgi:hypothetical protein
MHGSEEAGLCDSCGENPVVVRCGEKRYCQRCAEWMASSRIERAWSALEALDFATEAMLRAHFTRDEIERAVKLQLELGSGAMERRPLADWLTVDPPSMSEALGGHNSALIPPDFELLEGVRANGVH